MIDTSVIVHQLDDLVPRLNGELFSFAACALTVSSLHETTTDLLKLIELPKVLGMAVHEILGAAPDKEPYAGMIKETSLHIDEVHDRAIMILDHRHINNGEPGGNTYLAAQLRNAMFALDSAYRLAVRLIITVNQNAREADPEPEEQETADEQHT